MPTALLMADDADTIGHIDSAIAFTSLYSHCGGFNHDDTAAAIAAAAAAAYRAVIWCACASSV